MSRQSNVQRFRRQADCLLSIRSIDNCTVHQKNLDFPQMTDSPLSGDLMYRQLSSVRSVYRRLDCPQLSHKKYLEFVLTTDSPLSGDLLDRLTVFCHIGQRTNGLSTTPASKQFRLCLNDGPSIVQRPSGPTDCHLSGRSIDDWTVHKSSIQRVQI